MSLSILVLPVQYRQPHTLVLQTSYKMMIMTHSDNKKVSVSNDTVHLHMELPEGWMARQQGGCHSQQGRGFTSMGMARLWALHLPVLVQQASLLDLTASTRISVWDLTLYGCGLSNANKVYQTEDNGPDGLETVHLIPVIGINRKQMLSQLLRCVFYTVSKNSHHGAMAGPGTVVTLKEICIIKAFWCTTQFADFYTKELYPYNLPFPVFALCSDVVVNGTAALITGKDGVVRDKRVKKNCLLPTCSVFSWKINRVKGEETEKEYRVNDKQGFPAMGGTGSHPISAFVHDMHAPQQQYSSKCSSPKAESDLLQPEPLLNVSLSSRCFTANCKSPLTYAGTKAKWKSMNICLFLLFIRDCLCVFQSIIFIHDRNSHRQEVSAYIDYAHRLTTDDFEVYFSGKKRLLPRNTDLRPSSRGLVQQSLQSDGSLGLGLALKQYVMWTWTWTRKW
ncbi:hypothetical protein Q9966_003527 [Columba livia]|nr:hypothetical protein Q9966_003527 [Columba livia]